MVSQRRGGPKRGARRSGHGLPPGATDIEIVEFEGGALARNGRFISLQTAWDDATHERLIESYLSERGNLESSRSKLLDRLEQVLLDAGPADCFAFASIDYLFVDPETYEESSEERSVAQLEFLALRCLPLLKEAARKPRSQLPELAAEAMDLVEQAFAHTVDLINRESLSESRRAGSNTGAADYRRQAQVKALLVRGAAYLEHTRSIFDGCLVPFDATFMSHLGFSASDAWELATAFQMVVSERAMTAREEAAIRYEDSYKEVQRLRKKKQLPTQVARLTPTAQRRLALRGAFNERFEDPLRIVGVSPDELAKTAGLDESRARAWLLAMHCPPGEYNHAYHSVPVGEHPIVRMPLLRVDERFVAAHPGLLHEALRGRLEDLLREASPTSWETYQEARGRWLEREALTRLAAALPGSEFWSRVAWACSEGEGELDGLLRCDDLALRIQAKSGRVSPSARRGAPSMAEDVGSLIVAAVDQHARLAAAVGQFSPSELGFGAGQSEALLLPLSLDVVVTLDEVSVWSTETNRLRRFVPMPDTEKVPWVLSIADLMATTDLLQGGEFVHYLMRRQRLEREGNIEAHDELDWVGHYIVDGLYFDRYFEDPEAPDVFGLLSFTDSFDRWYFSRAGLLREPAERPRQPLAPELRSILARLESERPHHWVLAGVLLLNGDEASREQIVESMRHTAGRASQVGWSNVSQVFDSYGLTMWADLRLPSVALGGELQRYARQKCEDMQMPNWLVIGLGADGKIVVALAETNSDEPFHRTLMRRRRAGAP